ncbi:hypothetical protein A3J41_03185 [candidate division TM6 bacterium RIFCSPHIGHO2_12_FULL_38_8]|nr:MAG: hypothetical protein A3J41_03185 [candidate division TM6 bacterium RIFCSPHIGHO2_12_FULL_38_8]
MLFQNLLKKMTITGRVTHAYILLSTIQSGKFSDFIALLEAQSVGRSTRAVEKALIETMESKTEKDFLMLVAAAKDDGILTKISVDIKDKVHELLKRLQKNNNIAQTQQLEKFIHRSDLLTVLEDATSFTPKNIKTLPCHAINKRAERTTAGLTRFIQQRSHSAPPDRTSSEEE